MRYLFEEYAFDTDRRELHRGADVVSVAPQVFDLLDHLIRNRERVVSKDDLINAIGNGRSVSDGALTTRLNAARIAIGDSGDEQRLDAYSLYLRGSDRLYQFTSRQANDEALRLFNSAIELDPDFASAYGRGRTSATQLRPRGDEAAVLVGPRPCMAAPTVSMRPRLDHHHPYRVIYRL